MSDDTRLTRRGLLQLVTVIATASYAARRPLFAHASDTESAELDGTLPAPGRPTRLERFLRTRGIKPAHLARESGYSRQHLLRLWMGRLLPEKRCVLAVCAACRRLSRERVRLRDLFDMWLPNSQSEDE